MLYNRRYDLLLNELRSKLHEHLSVKEAEIFVCKDCGAVNISGKWIYDNVHNVIRLNADEIITNSVKVKEPFHISKYILREINVDYNASRINLTVSLDISVGEVVIVKNYSTTITIKIIKSLCPRCIALRGKAFNAIIQLRGTGRLDPRLIEKIANEIRKEYRDEIVDVKNVKEGIDLYLIDKELARRIAKELVFEYGALVKESFKLISRKPDGKIKSRLTISIRIPDIKPGDIVKVVPEDDIAIVENIGNGRISLSSVLNGRKYALSYKAYWEKSIEHYSGEVKEALVLSHIGGRKYILMDDEYNVFEAENTTIRKELEENSRVKVLIYKGKAYIIG